MTRTRAAERSRTGHARRCRGDQGSALIETTLAVPIVVVIVTGIVDFGVLYQRATIAYGATQAAVRTAASSGAARAADYLALRSFTTAFTSATGVTLKKIVIFKPQAEGSSSPISTTCFTSDTPSTSGKCNVYSGAAAAAIGTSYTTHFGPDGSSCGSTAWDRNWCPLTRLDQPDTPTDWLGVYVELSYQSVTGFWLRSGFSFTDRAVMRIEPKPAAS